MAEEGGHGEECSALRRLIILPLARNITLERQAYTRKNVALCLLEFWVSIRHQAFPEGLSVFARGFNFALGIYGW